VSPRRQAAAADCSLQPGGHDVLLLTSITSYSLHNDGLDLMSIILSISLLTKGIYTRRFPIRRATISNTSKKNQQHKQQSATYPSALTLGITSGMNQSTVQSSSKNPTKSSQLSIVGSSLQSSLKVSKNPNIRKSIYRISNVDDTSSIDDVMRHITLLNVRIISCFELKPSPRQKPGNKSFRVCIFANDKHLFLNKNNWASGLLIQDWVFHPKSTEQTPPTDATSASASTNNLSVSSWPSREFQEGAASIAAT